jgi:hypothetical protein
LAFEALESSIVHRVRLGKVLHFAASTWIGVREGFSTS